MQAELKEIHCKNCARLLLKAQVFVGEIKCGRCNHIAEYRLLTESFMQAVAEGEHFMTSTSSNVALAPHPAICH